MVSKGRARYNQIGAGPNLGQIKPWEALRPAAIEKQDANKIMNKIKCCSAQQNYSLCDSYMCCCHLILNQPLYKFNNIPPNVTVVSAMFL